MFRSSVRLAWIVILVVAGCSSEWDTVIEIGRVAYDQGAPQVSVPEYANVGASFTVDVTTQGGGCVTADSTDITATDDVADVTPYDRRMIPGEGEACTLNLVLLHHTVPVSFATPGVKTIRFHVQLPQAQGYVPGVLPMQVTVQ